MEFWRKTQTETECSFTGDTTLYYYIVWMFSLRFWMSFFLFNSQLSFEWIWSVILESVSDRRCDILKWINLNWIQSCMHKWWITIWYGRSNRTQCRLLSCGHLCYAHNWLTDLSALFGHQYIESCTLFFCVSLLFVVDVDVAAAASFLMCKIILCESHSWKNVFIAMWWNTRSDRFIQSVS